jgi:hypothetical protein
MDIAKCKETENNITLYCDKKSYDDTKRFFRKVSLLLQEEHKDNNFSVFCSDKECQIIITKTRQSTDKWQDTIFKLLKDNNILIKEHLKEDVNTNEKQALYAKKIR